jgi:uncharacterized iron-regulated protein
VYERLDRVLDSFTFTNFNANRRQYDAIYGSEYKNFYHWQLKDYKELCDFHVIQEFNLLKAKTFMPFTQFSEVYRQVIAKPKASILENTLA